MAKPKNRHQKRAVKSPAGKVATAAELQALEFEKVKATVAKELEIARSIYSQLCATIKRCLDTGEKLPAELECHMPQRLDGFLTLDNGQIIAAHEVTAVLLNARGGEPCPQGETAWSWNMASVTLILSNSAQIPCGVPDCMLELYMQRLAQVLSGNFEGDSAMAVSRATFADYWWNIELKRALQPQESADAPQDNTAPARVH